MSHFFLISLCLALSVTSVRAEEDDHGDKAPGGDEDAPYIDGHDDGNDLTKDTKDLKLIAGFLGDPAVVTKEEKKTTWGPFQGGKACNEKKNEPCCSLVVSSPKNVTVSIPKGTVLDISRVARPKNTLKPVLPKERIDPLGRWVMDINLHFEVDKEKNADKPKNEKVKGFVTCTLYSDKEREFVFSDVRKAFGKNLSLR